MKEQAQCLPLYAKNIPDLMKEINVERYSYNLILYRFKKKKRRDKLTKIFCASIFNGKLAKRKRIIISVSANTKFHFSGKRICPAAFLIASAKRINDITMAFKYEFEL